MATLASTWTAQSSDGDSSDDDGCLSDGADNDNPMDMLDQDEDVIRAAEEAQEEDLDEVAQSAELELMVTDSEQHAASTALSKVGRAVPTAREYLLTALDSLLNSRSRSTTWQAFLEGWKLRVLLPGLGCCG